ncbi:lipase family protein [Bacillus sp. 179-C3.3 HS]|uniref:lipase family protein n=1 Tax=Bacillus sp. 179-C3.3 HS TaxID=3232162 RepID=UPI00399EFC41
MSKNLSQNQFTEKDFQMISDASYAITNFKNSSEIKISNGRKLYVVDYQETKNGLNALTLVSREDYRNSNEGKDLSKIKNAVIAYRGSEPISYEQYKNTIKKHGTKEDGLAAYKNEIMQDWLVADTKYLVFNVPFENGEENQMVQADRYAKNIHKKMPNANMYVTGHSLGGSNASYVVANNDFIKSGVTFENPNIYPNLPPDLQAKALKGDYQDRLTEYINLNDGLSLLNRHNAEIGRVEVMYDAALPHGVNYSNPKKIQDLINVFNFIANGVNSSLDGDLFIEALKGAHNLGRYSFSSDGSVKTLDDMLRKNPNLTMAMLKQLKKANVAQNSAVAILIKSHVLMNIGQRFSSLGEHNMQKIVRKIEKLDNKVDQSVESVRSRFKQIVGFGAYDQLNAADVDTVISHLKTETKENEFYSVKSHDIAIDAAMNMKRWIDSVSEDISELGNQYHDADTALAKNMGIS